MTPAVSTTVKATDTTASSSTKYLKLSQLGIRVPLTSSISDLSYWWDGTQAWIISPTLETYAYSQDSNCAATYPTDLISSSNYQAIGTLDEGTTVDNQANSSVTLNGKVYSYHETSDGCSSDQSVIDMVNTYSSNFESALDKAQVLN